MNAMQPAADAGRSDDDGGRSCCISSLPLPVSASGHVLAEYSPADRGRYLRT